MNGGVQRRVRTVVLEENVLDSVAADPTNSIRKLAVQHNVSKNTISRIFQEQLLHPFHVQKVHALSHEDFPARVEFSNWVLEQHTNNRDFISSILYSDEAGFTKNGVINSHNLHVWADENPNSTVVARHQFQFQSVNVWAGIIGDHLIGPYVLPPRLNEELYLQFLQNNLQQLLEDVPLATRRNMWFMHDGAPPHFSIAVRQFLNNAYPNRWIGRGGPVACPPRSPDFNPLDFYLWGHLKNLVYSTPVETRDNLIERIVFYCDEIRNNAAVFWRIRQSLIRRARKCIEVGGAHVEAS